MLSHEKFRKFLGSIADGYNEARLHQLRAEMYAMAELLLDIHAEKKKAEAGQE